MPFARCNIVAGDRQFNRGDKLEGLSKASVASLVASGHATADEPGERRPVDDGKPQTVKRARKPREGASE